MKSITNRPSEYRFVGWWKKVMPYGGLETWPKPVGPLETVPVLPVSVNESPKA